MIFTIWKHNKLNIDIVDMSYEYNFLAVSEFTEATFL